MITERIHIANVKCGGCESTINKALQEIEGVTEAHANAEKGEVIVTYSKSEIHAEVLKKLKRLGYPQAEDPNTFADKAKSYASCMIGRLNA